MSMQGIKHTELTKFKISTALRSGEANRKLRECHKGTKAYNYKGNKVSYYGLHAWVARWLGKPSYCENCESTDKKRYEWANISGEYLRDLSDWARLCKSCHCLIDDVGNKVWAKRRAI